MHAGMTERRLLWCWVAGCLNVLVPKKRGTGFLKVPYGHHHITELTEIANSVNSDVCGLDGCLEFACSGSIYHGSTEDRLKYSRKIIPQLESYYGCQATEVNQAEYWMNHPLAVHEDSL